MDKIIKSIIIIGVVIGFTIGGMFGGVIIDRFVLNPPLVASAETSIQGLNIPLINEAFDAINRVYVDRQAVDSQKLTYGAISGMVDALGDTGHSRFLTPEMLKQEQSFTQGEFEGIGAEVEMQNNNVVIVAPIDGSPAQKAGIRPGTIILRVNGEDIDGLQLTDVVNKIIGPAGTKVTLTILDPGSQTPRDITLVRARITVHNVTWQMIPGTKIADLRIAGFSQGVTGDLKTALGEIQKQAATGIVLDLRNNPGGLLDEAVGVTSQFLSSGDVLKVKDANGKITSIPVQKGGIATNIPLVVLVNQGTASASEITSGALQDAHRASLVGEKTFGTGTVLNEFKLSDGSALLLATEEWLTPNGRVIWHQGIPPDVSVTLAANVYPQTPESIQTMTPQQLQNSGDAQLLKAMNLLQK